MLDKDLRKLDLYTLEDIYFTMKLYSDSTPFCLGVRRLHEIIERRKELENE